jgi:hypothetical protein
MLLNQHENEKIMTEESEALGYHVMQSEMACEVTIAKRMPQTVLKICLLL